MNEHATGYTVEKALELARALKHGPLPARGDPVPEIKQAIEVISRERKTCGFNWITGEVAQAVVTAYLEGMQAAEDAVSPYEEWSDEHRAWRDARRPVLSDR